MTPEDEVVWKYVNPAHAVKHESNEELIASLFEVLRLPPEFPTHWLDTE